MKAQSTFSPVSLRYIAALRGHKPAQSVGGFTYGEAFCNAPEKMICLAASNPEGRFYGFVENEAARRASEDYATQRGIFNAIFLVGAPSEILARLANGSSLPPMLDYLCCDESEKVLTSTERTALFDLAQKRLSPGGLFVTSYRPHTTDSGAFNFLVREMAPEMNAEQKQEFLLELKHLGAPYLSRHADVAAKLKEAIVKGTPDSFFSLFTDASKSGTFDTMVAMGPRGLVYGGDARLGYNYVELSVPADAQDIIVKCRTNVLYEPIKDVVLDRAVRSDIWVKSPFTLSANPTELFGSFAYGITMSRTQVPSTYAAEGKAIDLSSPLYVKLINLMSVLPMGIGDFMAHPAGKDEQPEKIIEALQVLVACGIANPMRGARVISRMSSVAQPRLLGAFNRFMDKTTLTNQDVYLSSPVMGCGVEVTARDALVMQALNRAGLANSVSALMPELRRLAETSPQNNLFPGMGEPTAEMAHKMVLDVVGESLPQWYAYGLLEAA